MDSHLERRFQQAAMPTPTPERSVIPAKRRLPAETRNERTFYELKKIND